MREHEERDVAAAMREVGHHDRASGVAAVPAAAGVHDDPAARAGAEGERIALPHVEHVQLRRAAVAARSSGSATGARTAPSATSTARARVASPRTPPASATDATPAAHGAERGGQHDGRRERDGAPRARNRVEGAASSACAASAASRSTAPTGMASAEEQQRLEHAPSRDPPARFVTGPRSGTRPKVHATRGAVATRGDDADDAAARASPRATRGHASGTTRRARVRRPRSSAAVPATLSCQPEIEHDARLDAAAAPPPSASIAHGDVGPLQRARQREAAPSITAARTAGGGAPMAAT